jgi:hypothetical protein
MKTFTKTVATKAQVLKVAKSHQKADSYRQTFGYWNAGKGCSVGCILHSFGAVVDEHKESERLFGIPEEMTMLQDRIFEGLPKAKSDEWTVRYFEAIPRGVDLAPVLINFKVRLLQECLVYDRAKYPEVDKAVHQVCQALKGIGSLESAAESAVESAWPAWSAWSAWSATKSAWTATWSAVESATKSAAKSAAYEKIADILIEELERAA